MSTLKFIGRFFLFAYGKHNIRHYVVILFRKEGSLGNCLGYIYHLLHFGSKIPL